MTTVTTLFRLNQPDNGSMAAPGATETITLMAKDVCKNVVTTAAPARRNPSVSQYMSRFVC